MLLSGNFLLYSNYFSGNLFSFPMCGTSYVIQNGRAQYAHVIQYTLTLYVPTSQRDAFERFMGLTLTGLRYDEIFSS